MKPLKIFTQENGIYTGVNTPQFTQLEYIATSAVNQYKPLPNLGFFGEASTGKTTTATLLVSNMPKHTLISINSSGLTEQKLAKIVTDTMIAKYNVDYYTTWGNYTLDFDEKTNNYTSFVQMYVIFLDEAQLLSTELQTMLLSVFDKMSEGSITKIGEGTKKNPSFSTKRVSFILATTDTSKLLYPLTTRLTSITFDQYSKEDIKNIIGLKHPNISDGARGIIANCSKLVPRVAIRLSEQLINFCGGTQITEAQAVDFAKNFLNMEENGIDSIDKRILLYLANHKKKIEPVDVISLEMNKKIKERLEAKTQLTNNEHKELNRAIFQIAILEQKISRAEFTPKSRQDISLACRILDLRDLETRLTFLEKLSLVDKLPKGILLNEKYL
jgi:Holliday junction resolvasome RuvABC ATP-dependent DNA helicase subunit